MSKRTREAASIPDPQPEVDLKSKRARLGETNALAKVSSVFKLQIYMLFNRFYLFLVHGSRIYSSGRVDVPTRPPGLDLNM